MNPAHGPISRDGTYTDPATGQEYIINRNGKRQNVIGRAPSTMQIYPPMLPGGYESDWLIYGPEEE